MSEQGGGLQPGYNPHAVGAAPGGQPDPQSRALGILPDANVGTGMALNNLSPVQGNLPISFFGQKQGLVDTLATQFGMRTKVQFSGELMNLMEGVGGTAQEVYGAGEAIHSAGGAHVGGMSEAMLGGLAPPDTPGMSRGQSIGKQSSYAPSR
jgi:hypothetical protein